MKDKNKPWSWIPSLYFAEGLPYVLVMTVSVIMYKRLGVSNADITLYTGWLYLPWVIKPFWSPIVELFKTKRWWIWSMQLLIGAALGGVALTIPVPDFFRYTLAFFWLLAFSSATHDMAADGFYMLGLSENQQAYFVGIRSTFYRLAMIMGQGILIMFAGYMERSTGLEPLTFSVQTQVDSTAFELPMHATFSESEEELSFVLSHDHIMIGLNKLDSEVALEMKMQAKAWNLKHGFVTQESGTKRKQDSWWTSKVSDPLKAELKTFFGTDNLADVGKGKQGNIAAIGIRLNRAPTTEEEFILNVRHDSGNKDVSLIAGQRLNFNKENWQQWACILVQVDPKQKGIVEAHFKAYSGNIQLSWSFTCMLVAIFLILTSIYHRVVLPKPLSDVSNDKSKVVWRDVLDTFVSFFRKKHIGVAILFILLFRLGESQLVRLASPFLLDAREVGGLGLTTGEVGLLYGTIGIIFLTLGGVLGGWVVSRQGLKYWMLGMALAINLPNLAYVYLAWAQVDNWYLLVLGVALEQFGYGFGFTAYMLYLIYFCEGKHKTAHYAIGTGLMALGMMLPGMVSGWIQEVLGYEKFFVWVMLCTLPGFIIIRFLAIDKNFGRKET